MILMYHKVFPESPTMWWVTVNDFWRQMEELRTFEVVSLDEYDPNNAKHAVITFDGIYENVHTYAFPILKRFNYPFELFLVGDTIGKGNEFDQPVEPPARFADVQQLKAMAARGARLQWHSRTHRDLTTAQAGSIMETELDVPADIKALDPRGFTWFAYPHGKHTPQLVSATKNKFKGALSCVAGNDQDRYQYNRITVTNETRLRKSRVSVIVPNFNYGHLLEEAIDSLLHQTIKPDEILFIDDNSSDNSMAVVERYRSKIRIVRNETNLGITANFKKAVSLTSGDYICFLGADNRFRSDYIEKCTAALDSHPDAAIAYTHALIFGPFADVWAKRFTARPLPHSAAFIWEVPAFSEEVRRTLMQKNVMHGSSMYRRSAYDAVGGYRDSSGPEDQNLFARMLAQGYDAVLCGEPLLEYRQHSNRQDCSQRIAVMEVARIRSQVKEKDLYIASLNRTISEYQKRLTKAESSLAAHTQLRITERNSTSEAGADRASGDDALQLIAFYLPQYHPIPENDLWWGKGFTEWTNVAKARPLYPAHYQPHIPADLGFYDLRLPEVRQAQADMARAYGVTGFCYYHYWFNGRRLLNRPLDEVLNFGAPDLDFCLCWANEHWTRAWDGRNGEVLIDQVYSEEDDRAHIQWLLTVFKDKRYIRVNGKPLMLVYLSTRLPQAKRTSAIWREEARKAGEELYLCKVESAPNEYGDPAQIGFDASVEFQPDWGNLGPVKAKLPGEHVVLDYASVSERMIRKPVPGYKRFPCVTPRWDNSPRRQQASVILDGSTPEQYGRWLQNTLSKLPSMKLDRDIVFINAWNEWGEGNHLEPDQKYGLKYLDATRTALARHRESRRTPGLVSIIILTFNQLAYTKECMDSIRNHTAEPHEIILVDNASTDGTVPWLKELAGKYPNCRLIENTTNLGFAQGCNQGIAAASGEYILLLNNDVVVTEGWLGGMLECLTRDPNAGIVGPMTNNISGTQQVPLVEYTAIAGLNDYAARFREQHRHRRVEARRLVGFCMLFRRSLVDEIGVLDQSFGTGNYEDDDYCLRAAVAGHTNYIAGDIFIHHYGSRSFIGNTIDHTAMMTGNRAIYNSKWNGLAMDTELGRMHAVLRAREAAETLVQQGKTDAAISMLMEAIKTAPTEAGSFMDLARLLISAKQYAQAQEVLDKMPRNELDADQVCLEGYCKEGAGLLDEAVTLAERALTLKPKHAHAINLQGVVAYRKGLRDEAARLFRAAMEADPGYGEPFTNLGVLLWSGDQQQEALDHLERGMILSPSEAEIIASYHSAITATGSVARAEQVFREALALYPDNRSLLFLFIDVLLKREKWDAAMPEIERAMIDHGIDDGILAAALDVRGKVGPLDTVRSRAEHGSLSLCMIVKDEEQHLARCLMSAKPIVDEMIVVDTGSSDRTRDIARAFGAKVFDFAWTGSFDAARNHSLEKATGDWILVLDADEVISSQDHLALISLLGPKNSPRPIAYSLTTRNYVKPVNIVGWTANDGRYPREEAGTGWNPSAKVRLFPRDDRIRFKNPVHELVEPTIRKIGIRIAEAAIPIHHYGKLDQEKWAAKGEIYYLLGKKKLEENGDTLDALLELAVQAKELKRFDEATDLWRRVIRLRPDMAVAYLNLASIYLNTKRYEDALAASNEAIRRSPDSKEAVYNHALGLLFTGNAPGASTVLAKLLTTAQDYPPARILFALASWCTNDKSPGMKLFSELRSVHFDFAGPLAEVAQQLIDAGQLAYASAVLDAAVESGNVNDDILRLRNAHAAPHHAPGERTVIA